MKNNTQPALKERIEKALEDFTKGRASMHVPPLDTDVDMVLAECSDRLSKLEARCAALAAENAGLKAACGGDGSYRDCPACAHSEYIEAPETPATDAFLVEVRELAKAEGVQEYADSLRHSASKIRECYGDNIRVRALLHEASNADKFAAQLRKGVQS
ncbi:TPA: hypothetical protein ACHVFR_003711 [Enterobacter roggenkampii]